MNTIYHSKEVSRNRRYGMVRYVDNWLYNHRNKYYSSAATEMLRKKHLRMFIDDDNKIVLYHISCPNVRLKLHHDLTFSFTSI